MLQPADLLILDDIAYVTNPIAAAGGTAPEPMAEAKLSAPQAFRAAPSGLRRAITPDDYARIAERDLRLQLRGDDPEKNAINMGSPPGLYKNILITHGGVGEVSPSASIRPS